MSDTQSLRALRDAVAAAYWDARTPEAERIPGALLDWLNTAIHRLDAEDQPDPLASKDHGVARAASMPEVARLRKEWWSPEEHKAEVSKRCFEEHHRVTKQWKSLFDAMCDRAYKAEARVREVEGELAATSEIADALQAKQAALRAALEEER